MPEPGDRMVVLCEGGPSPARLVTFPPPLEIGVDPGGVYVLDERPAAHGIDFVYVFVADPM